MGLMDKMKAQANQISQKAQETARDGKVKFDQAQGKRRADAMLRNLGALVYAERTGRAAADSQAQIDKLIADISAHEAENGISLSPETADPHADGAAQQSGSTKGPAPLPASRRSPARPRSRAGPARRPTPDGVLARVAGAAGGVRATCRRPARRSAGGRYRRPGSWSPRPAW